MKKVLFLHLFISFLAFEVNAQLTGGLKGGINLSSQKWKIELLGESDSQSYDGVGFHIGGYLNYDLSEVVSLQPEMLYNSLKFDLDGEDVTLDYISLPVMLGYGFDDNKLILQAGPQLGILLSSDPKEFKDDEYFKSIDFSLCFGAIANFGKFNLSARYAIGLSNITDDKLVNDVKTELENLLGVPVDLSLDVKNNNLQFSVGYKLFGN